MSINPYYGVRFLIIERTAIADTVIDERDSDFTNAPEMRKALLIHVENLRRDCPEKDYFLNEFKIGDQPNEV